MHRHAVNRRQLDHIPVQRRVTLLHQPRLHPILAWGELASASPTPRLDFQAPVLALQDHHVVHKARRNPDVTRSLPMAVTLFDNSNDTTADLNRMCFDHSQPLHLAGSGKHKPANMGILNRCERDVLEPTRRAVSRRYRVGAGRQSRECAGNSPTRRAGCRPVSGRGRRGERGCGIASVSRRYRVGATGRGRVPSRRGGRGMRARRGCENPRVPRAGGRGPSPTRRARSDGRRCLAAGGRAGGGRGSRQRWCKGRRHG